MIVKNAIQLQKRVSRLVLVITSFIKEKIPWLYKILVAVPKPYRPAVYVIAILTSLIQILGISFIKEIVMDISYCIHGPKVMITVLPPKGSDLSSYGELNVLNEFKFDPQKIKKRLKPIHENDNIQKLLADYDAIPIRPFTCNKEGNLRSN